MFLMVFVVVAAAVSTVSVLASQGTAAAMQDIVFFTARRDERIATQLLSRTAGVQVGSESLRSLEARAAAMGEAMGTTIYLVDQEGQILYDSAHALTGQAVALPPQWPGPFDTPLVVEDQPAFVVVGYAPPWQAGVAPFPPPDGISGDRLLAFSGSPWLVKETSEVRSEVTPGLRAQAALGSFNQTLLLAAVAGGGVALVLTAALSRGIVGPVEALTAAVRRMERGDRRQRVVVHSRDEMGELAHAFNAMADSISCAEQLRRQMVSDIAHELRTPLTNIRGYLEAVRDGVVAPKAEVIESLHEESMLLSRLVTDLQELALAEAGQLALRRQPVAMAEVVEKTLTALGPHLAGGPRVETDVPADLPRALADPERLGQVLRNLVTNAQHHTPAGGTITIAARAQPEAVEVAVTDTGSGIAPEHLPYVFERFYRADPARARATGGAGLGLAIVKQLVEAHGGQARVESAPGCGATFTFTLPRAAAA
jgi:signal transduction histidine kinase